MPNYYVELDERSGSMFEVKSRRDAYGKRVVAKTYDRLLAHRIVETLNKDENYTPYKAND